MTGNAPCGYPGAVWCLASARYIAPCGYPGAAGYRVLLTARGRELQVPLDREMDQLNQDFLGQFPPQEAKLLRELLTHIAGQKDSERGASAQG